MNSRSVSSHGDVFLTWSSMSKAPSLKRIVRKSMTKAVMSPVLYTLLVLDQDAPYPDRPTDSPRLMYLRINIGYAGTRGDELLPYVTSSTEEDIAHRFVAIAFIQKAGRIDTDHLGLDIQPVCFPLKTCVKKWKLKNHLQCFKLAN